ncbi:hypothetical protein UVI_02015290 [Ustilaginoidea virens]|uniref:Uncharacterized protein n=1 Tax=Ustilaginoidea virens TaxID=1159556 RepID=A0A1B5KUD5_USTVR|nr:hypothetical protein UVI_02015290 [Ustilaginoidea virens]
MKFSTVFVAAFAAVSQALPTEPDVDEDSFALIEERGTTTTNWLDCSGYPNKDDCLLAKCMKLNRDHSCDANPKICLEDVKGWCQDHLEKEKLAQQQRQKEDDDDDEDNDGKQSNDAAKKNSAAKQNSAAKNSGLKNSGVKKNGVKKNGGANSHRVVKKKTAKLNRVQ